jgi:diacylglycerol kinase family enzyme
MRVTLMHNPEAGTKEPSRKELVEHFKRAGHKVSYQLTTQDNYAQALEDPGDLIAIAGGDGTVAKIALHLVGRSLPFAVVPIGTANNIARALGWEGDPRDLIPMLSSAQPVRIDVGTASGPWGETLFLEGVGAGLFPRMMATRARNRHKEVPDPVDTHGGLHGGIRLLQEVLSDYRGREFHLWIDGGQVSGNFLLAEALNIPAVGPALELAPHADPGDGFLDLVLVREEERTTLERLLTATLANDREPPALSVHRARKIRLAGPGSDLHYDDELWPDNSISDQDPDACPRPAEIEIGIRPGALKALVP